MHKKHLDSDGECKHHYVKLMAQDGEKLVPSSLWTCLECGILRVGTHTIRISKTRLNMGGHPITNAGVVTATELHGTVYYADMHFEETECAVCGTKFKKKDRVTLYVRKTTQKGIGLLPAHLKCLKKD